MIDRPAGSRRLYQLDPRGLDALRVELDGFWTKALAAYKQIVDRRRDLLTPERTRVELEHRNLERHGDGWESVRDGIGGDGGWPLYLQRYADEVAQSQ